MRRGLRVSPFFLACFSFAAILISAFPMNATDLEALADGHAAARHFGAARDALAQLVTIQPDHFDAWLKLSAMCGALGDGAGALDALTQALAQRPLDFTALLMRATQLDRAGRVDDAGEAFGRALAQAPDTSPPHLAPVLAMATKRYQAWQVQQAEALRVAVKAITPLTQALDGLITNTLHITAPDRTGPTHYCYPGLPEIPFHDRADFPWIAPLEAQTDEIEAAFHTVVAAEAAQLVPYIQYGTGVPLDQWDVLNNNPAWTAIHLLQNGRVVEPNARHCPELMALLSSIPQPDIAGAGPNAMFSLLAPGAHIPPHTGISNARLVCHLPLIVPPGCWFRVADDKRLWSRGTAWVFDDTIEHEALNPSEALRVILIIDVWHPALDAAARAGVTAVIGAGGKVHGL
jgi:tetratricopeptide (TPR) repeat protein